MNNDQLDCFAVYCIMIIQGTPFIYYSQNNNELVSLVASEEYFQEILFARIV